MITSSVAPFWLPSQLNTMVSRMRLVLHGAYADEFLQNFDPAVSPLGIITLEDSLLVKKSMTSSTLRVSMESYGEPYIHGSISSTDPGPPELG
ncbi:hypothetical protein BDZ89DRAFT_1142374 [Hymenopellis radicata]|nr:hypothetical protein BDZ89DRAFT_1142374 [Hymenopellis radicata]